MVICIEPRRQQKERVERLEAEQRYVINWLCASAIDVSVYASGPGEVGNLRVQVRVQVDVGRIRL